MRHRRKVFNVPIWYKQVNVVTSMLGDVEITTAIYIQFR